MSLKIVLGQILDLIFYHMFKLQMSYLQMMVVVMMVALKHAMMIKHATLEKSLNVSIQRKILIVMGIV